MRSDQRHELVEGLVELITARLLWVLLPARHALNLRGEKQLSEIVSWAAKSVAEDVNELLNRYGVCCVKEEK